MSRISSFILSLIVLSSLQASAADVVSSIRPLDLIVKELLPPSVKSHSLLDGAVSPHDYALRMSDAQALKHAETFIWVGPGMEGFLTKAVSKFVEPENEVRLAAYFDREPDQHHHHSHAHDHSDHADNMHLWLSYENAEAIARSVANNIALKRPELKSKLETNLKRFTKRLAQEQQVTQQALLVYASKPFYVYHDAYRDYVNEFGLTQLNVAKRVPDASLSLKRVIALKREVADAACMLANVDELAEAQALATKLNLRLIGVDLLAANASIQAQPDAEAYDFFAYMAQVRSAFASCFGEGNADKTARTKEEGVKEAGQKKEEAAVAASSNL